MTPDQAKVNYERWIRSAMESGLSPEEIAKGFTETMNAINSKKTAEEQAEQEKQNYYDEMEDFLFNLDCDSLDAAEIAAAATIMFWDNDVFVDWPLDKIKRYRAFMESLVATSADSFEKLENLSNAFTGFGKFLGTDIPPADLSDKKFFEIPVIKPGTTWTSTGKDLDKVTIDKFLELFRK